MRLIIDVEGKNVRLEILTDDGGNVSVRQVLAIIEQAENAVLDGIGVPSQKLTEENVGAKVAPGAGNGEPQNGELKNGK